MKKRVVSLLLVFALVFTLIPASAVTAFAASYSGTVNGVNWSIDEDGVLTISPGTATDTYKSGEMGDMDSYSYSGWKMVGCSELVTKIVIKDGVTGIGDYAFYNMPNVTEVVMADSVEFIGDYAFFYCYAIESADFSENIESIGENAFYGCEKLTEVKLSSDLKSIGKYAFQYCDALASVSLEEGLETIGSYAFQGCTALTDITFPSTVKSVGVDVLDETAFATAQSGNDFVICGNTLVSSNVTSFYSDYPCVIPEGVVCIADKAFVDVTIVGTLELPESLLYIGNLSFDGGHYNAYNCDKTLDVIDLKNVVSIGDYAFRYWYYLDEVDLSNVTYLGEGAFYWCNYLESVKMAESMDYIGDGVFSESGQKTDAGEVTVTNAPDFSNYVYCGSFIDTNIMNAGADGTDDGYYYCNSMLLKVVKVDGNTYEDGIVVADGTRVIADGALMAFSSAAGVTALHIPETVEVIGDLCYYGTLTDVYYAGDKAGWNKIEKLNEGNFGNLTVHCAKSSAVSLEDCTVKLSYSKTTYTGKAKTPTVTVTDSDGNKLTKGADYTVIYSNNKNAGTATVTVTGQGNYCDTVEKTFTISKVTASNITAALSYKKTTYNGKQKTPTVNATDNNGNTLVADTDYTVTFGKSTRKSVGRYKVTVTFKGNYSGSKTFYFTIVPGATSTVVTTLSNETGGYDDVIVRWDYVTGASGYYLYYKKSGDDTWSKAIDCGKTRTYTKKDLTDGTRYNFKVVAYYKSSSGTKYTALKSVSSSIYTLQKVKNPVVKKASSAKIKMTWTEINGETGYQIQRMTVKNNKYVVQKSYYNDKNDSNIIISPKKGTKYYYRVRAYKTEKINGKSVKVYGPWSIVKPYKLV